MPKLQITKDATGNYQLKFLGREKNAWSKLQVNDANLQKQYSRDVMSAVGSFRDDTIKSASPAAANGDITLATTIKNDKELNELMRKMFVENSDVPITYEHIAPEEQQAESVAQTQTQPPAKLGGMLEGLGNVKLKKANVASNSGVKKPTVDGGAQSGTKQQGMPLAGADQDKFAAALAKRFAASENNASAVVDNRVQPKAAATVVQQPLPTRPANLKPPLPTTPNPNKTKLGSAVAPSTLKKIIPAQPSVATTAKTTELQAALAKRKQLSEPQQSAAPSTTVNKAAIPAVATQPGLKINKIIKGTTGDVEIRIPANAESLAKGLKNGISGATITTEANGFLIKVPKASANQVDAAITQEKSKFEAIPIAAPVVTATSPAAFFSRAGNAANHLPHAAVSTTTRRGLTATATIVGPATVVVEFTTDSKKQVNPEKLKKLVDELNTKVGRDGYSLVQKPSNGKLTVEISHSTGLMDITTKGMIEKSLESAVRYATTAKLGM